MLTFMIFGGLHTVADLHWGQLNHGPGGQRRDAALSQQLDGIVGFSTDNSQNSEAINSAHSSVWE